ncbi:hypothetical protein H6B15_12110 [Gemmiger formicilis]|uniref:hypothetical protein n=1 Tax=Gemmiger formicilis TaxID=745368 RepID=UPI00195BE02C|nr:hypothetical protein [Gemmiger formicilis]MBM6717398.1 hypothetical protein [Gemmiger formicilis]
MLKHKLVLGNGTVLTSGPGTGNAIRSVTLTEQVSDSTDLCPGAACAACAELELWAPENGLRITQGETLTLYRLDTDAGTETKAGIFLAEKPTKSSANVYKVTAYDRMNLFDKDLSAWLRDNQGMFPLALTEFLRKLCDQCGVALKAGTLDDLPNGGYRIRAFSASDLTGRQLLQWAAQAAGRFARITADGTLELAWYEEPSGKSVIVAPGETVARTALRLAGSVLRTRAGTIWRMGNATRYYLQGTLQYEEYDTAPLDKVQIRQSEEDVGVLWPADAKGDNALVLEENLLLTADSPDALRTVARTLYEQMGAESYTPLQVTLPFSEDLRPGMRLDVLDPYGRVHHTLVMKRTVTGQIMELESTGNARRDSTAAVNRQSWRDVSGRMLEIKTDIDGMKITLSGKLDGQDAQTLIEQNLEGLTLSAQAGEKASTLTLKAGQTTLTSAQITFSGMVEFADLSTPGRTAINGANLRTGVVLSNSGYTRLDLDSGVFQVGKDDTVYVHLEPDGITWRGGQDVDGATAHGQIRATEDRLWVTSDTRYQMFGWRHEASGTYQCLEMEQVDNAVSVPNRLNVGGVCSVRTLLAWDAKERVVQTETWGSRGMAAMESPEPLFFDAGSGVLDENGVCCIEAAPVYEEVTSPTVERRWYVTPTAAGTLWVEKTPWGAVVHGTPGMPFDWMVSSVQRGYEGVYAEAHAEPYPDVRCKPGDFLNEEVLDEVFGPILQTEREESE